MTAQILKADGLSASRSEAKERGDKYFFTGAACKRGHISTRFVSDNGCTECKKEQSKRWYSDKERGAEKMRKWRAENPEKDKETRRAWVSATRDERNAYSREYYARNPEKERAKNRRWYVRNIDHQRQRAIEYRNANIEIAREKSRAYNAANKPKVAAIARNRRARQRDNGGTHTEADVLDIFRLQKGKCAICQTKLDDTYHVDHIIPLKAGGSNDRRNLQILCAPCNQSKSARDPIAFMQMRGMLL